MKFNPLNQRVLTKRTSSTGRVTREMVHARSRELSLTAGRLESEVAQEDYERAKQELTGESDGDRQDAILDALPESKCWDPVPGSEGRQLPESSREDEDDQGRSETEQLVEKGAEEAERDRIQQAARIAKKNM